MKNEPAISILGATGLIGNEITVLLGEDRTLKGSYSLYSSPDSAGEYYQIGSDEVVVQELSSDSLKEKDLVIIALPQDLAEEYARKASEKKLRAVDATGTLFQSALSGEVNGARLVVAGVNDADVTAADTLLINPNQTVTVLAPILKAIHERSGLKRIVASTYQGCASGGKGALDELWEQTRAVFNMKDMPHDAFQHQVAFNAVPQIGTMLEDGSSSIEERITRELRSVLHIAELGISITAVRIPVFYGDSISLNVETEKALSIEDMYSLLESLPSSVVSTNPADFPMAIDVVSSTDLHIGRVRKDASAPHAYSMWIVADSVRRGSAVNAIGLAKLLLQKAA